MLELDCKQLIEQLCHTDLAIISLLPREAFLQSGSGSVFCEAVILTHTTEDRKFSSRTDHNCDFNFLAGGLEVEVAGLDRFLSFKVDGPGSSLSSSSSSLSEYFSLNANSAVTNELC